MSWLLFGMSDAQAAAATAIMALPTNAPAADEAELYARFVEALAHPRSDEFAARFREVKLCADERMARRVFWVAMIKWVEFYRNYNEEKRA